MTNGSVRMYSSLGRQILPIDIAFDMIYSASIMYKSRITTGKLFLSEIEKLLKSSRKAVTFPYIALKMGFNSYDEMIEWSESHEWKRTCIKKMRTMMEDYYTQMLLDASRKDKAALWKFMSHHFGYSEKKTSEKTTTERTKIIVLPEKKPVGSKVDIPREIEHTVVDSVPQKSEKKPKKCNLPINGIKSKWNDADVPASKFGPKGKQREAMQAAKEAREEETRQREIELNQAEIEKLKKRIEVNRQKVQAKAVANLQLSEQIDAFMRQGE